jgi:hypothetical protein
MTSTLRIGVWNVEWATARSRGPAVRARLAALQADILVVTEGCEAVLPPDGHVVTSGDDYGYRRVSGRRKVLLWSRRAWQDLDAVGSTALPPGRFVAASTTTAIGPARVLGVCIPWKDAHVTTGQRNRRAWQDHLTYLEALRRVVEGDTASALVIAGDFNQRVPREGQPQHVYDALERALGPRLHVATAGLVPGASTSPIDHVAHTGSLVASRVEAWPRLADDGRELSDHEGVTVELSLR